MSEDFFKDIIFKVLNGDATAHEKRMLAGWLRDDPAREEFFYYCLSVHEGAHPQYLADVDTAGEAYEKFIKGEIRRPSFHNHAAETKRPFRLLGPATRWWMAASILIFLCARLYFFSDVYLYRTYSANPGAVKPVVLEDGSRVTLNANSSIKVYRDFFQRKNREVWIKGEAFFEVSRTSDLKKFIVHTKNFDVVVLGTKFNVRDRRGKTQVMLEEGKVKLLARHREPLIMKPGEQVTVLKGQDAYNKKMVRRDDYMAWQHSKMIFDNTPLTDVAQVIQDYYGIQIVIADSLLATRQFTGTLPNNDLDVILMALRTAYPMQIERNDEQIIMKKIVN
jgi:ferric-dicitrate binding protein FerR (iron transport regulator)